MKRSILWAALVLASTPLFALPSADSGYVRSELKIIDSEYGTRNLADLKVSELIPVAERLSVARQKDGFVLLAGGLSFAWPGAGQFMAGDWSGGALHTGLHLGVSAASLAWAHSLLPADLQWGRLDYWNADRGTVETAWRSHKASDFLPAVGALTAGVGVDLVLRFWSAADAVDTAKKEIDDGKITFEPRFSWGRMGLGMRF